MTKTKSDYFVPQHGQVILGTIREADSAQPRLYRTDDDWQFVGKRAAEHFSLNGSLALSIALHAVTHGYVVRRTCWVHQNCLQQDPATGLIMKYRHPVLTQNDRLKFLGWQQWLPSPEDLVACDWLIRRTANPDTDFTKPLQ